MFSRRERPAPARRDSKDVSVVRRVEIEPTFESWQAAARALLREGVPPAEIAWEDSGASQPGLPGLQTSATAPPASRGAASRVPRRFLELARQVARHHDPSRWQLLYEVLWRLVHGDRDLLETPGDPRVGRLLRLEDEARRAVASPATARGRGATAPPGAGLDDLRLAAANCTACDLYRHATQTVFGRGPRDARIVLVGEQPGDQEDLQGAPFVGPAGDILDRALGEVGLVRDRLYVTNAVKHFKFVERGKRRIHQTPRLSELLACRPWLEAELAAIGPEIVVCLGATAARALLGPDFRLMKERGRFLTTRWAPKTIATLHPSAVLRGEDDETQARLYHTLVGDLRLVAAVGGS
jgi:DNA polymerase